MFSFVFLNINHVCACLLSCFGSVQLFVIPWTAACQPPLSMGFSRQEYWSELSCPPPGDFPNPGTEPASPNAICKMFFFSLGILDPAPFSAWSYVNHIYVYMYIALSEVSRTSVYYHLLQINFDIQTPKPSDVYSLVQRPNHYLT